MLPNHSPTFRQPSACSPPPPALSFACVSHTVSDPVDTSASGICRSDPMPEWQLLTAWNNIANLGMNSWDLGKWRGSVRQGAALCRRLVVLVDGVRLGLLCADDWWCGWACGRVGGVGLGESISFGDGVEVVRMHPLCQLF